MERLGPIPVETALAGAVAALKSGRLRDVEMICRQIVAVAPRCSQAWQLWGMAAVQAGQADVAVELLRRAREIDPDDGLLRARLGEALRVCGRLHEAADEFAEAARLAPDVVEIRAALGDAWARIARSCTPAQAEQAEAAYRRAMSLPGHDPSLPAHLGKLLMELGRTEEAIEQYRIALTVPGIHPSVRRSLMLAMNYSDRMSDEEIFEEHRKWGEDVERMAGGVAPHSNERSPERVLRVGYVSADFREHAVWKWLEPVLEHHDRGRFEIHGYSCSDARDAATRRAEELCTRWRSFVWLSDDEADALIRRDGIDILVDLAGHTAPNRLELFARKPAPVQLTWLGYPGTTGLSRIDYRLTDARVDPPGMTEKLHTEALLRLPGGFSCYRPPADAPDVSPLPALSNGFVTFGSFNRVEKMSERVVALWAEILRRVPRSRLLIKSSSFLAGGVGEWLRRRFDGLGVGERIELAGAIATERAHLAAYHRIDIALDTFPFHGTTTTADALWMGVPVMSLIGSAHRSRVGLTLLGAVGLGGLAAGSGEEFVERAVSRAADLTGLARLRGELRERMGGSRLTDAPAFARELEETLRTAWRGYCSA